MTNPVLLRSAAACGVVHALALGLCPAGAVPLVLAVFVVGAEGGCACAYLWAKRTGRHSAHAAAHAVLTLCHLLMLYIYCHSGSSFDSVNFISKIIGQGGAANL